MTTLTINSLDNLKKEVTQQGNNTRSYCNIENVEYVDLLGNSRTKTIITIQNKGNKYPLKTIASYSVIASLSKEHSEVVSKFFVDKYNKMEGSDKLKHDDQTIVTALVSKGILTKTKLASYSNLQVSNLIREYGETVLNKTIKALPTLLGDLYVDKTKQVSVNVTNIKTLEAEYNEKIIALDKKLESITKLEKELETKLAKASKPNTQAGNSN